MRSAICCPVIITDFRKNQYSYTKRIGEGEKKQRGPEDPGGKRKEIGGIRSVSGTDLKPASRGNSCGFFVFLFFCF